MMSTVSDTDSPPMRSARIRPISQARTPARARSRASRQRRASRPATTTSPTPQRVPSSNSASKKPLNELGSSFSASKMSSSKRVGWLWWKAHTTTSNVLTTSHSTSAGRRRYGSSDARANPYRPSDRRRAERSTRRSAIVRCSARSSAAGAAVVSLGGGEVLVLRADPERQDDLADAAEQREEAHPDQDQCGTRRVVLLRGPEAQQHLEDADGEAEAPHAVHVLCHHRDDDVGRPHEDQQEAEHGRERPEGLFRLHERPDRGEAEEDAQQRVHPSPAPRDPHRHELVHAANREHHTQDHADRGDRRLGKAEDDQRDDEPEDAGDEEHPPQSRNLTGRFTFDGRHAGPPLSGMSRTLTAGARPSGDSRTQVGPGTGPGPPGVVPLLGRSRSKRACVSRWPWPAASGTRRR